MKIRILGIFLSVFQAIKCDVGETGKNISSSREYLPYVQVFLCPMQKQPWECFREQSGRVLDLLDNSYQSKWNAFKDEVNNEIVGRFQARGFSANEKVREKTSSIFDKIETGVTEIKEYAQSTANTLLGREDEEEPDTDTDVDYIEIEDDDSVELLDIEEDEDEKKKGGAHGGGHGIKIKKKKKKPHQGIVSTLDEHDDVELAADLLGGLGGHAGGHGIKLPHKYGRSLGVTRGKKKKKKKALMKIVLIGSLIKAKIELLLKLLSAHLQIKFFAIAVLGLLLNLVRFWLDIKRGQAPQKVVYYEHAHHQHHYDDHDDWDHGGYWRRSNAASTEYYSEGLDDESQYSRIGRNDYYPSASSASSYSKSTPNRMAYIRQIPTGARTQ